MKVRAMARLQRVVSMIPDTFKDLREDLIGILDLMDREPPDTWIESYPWVQVVLGLWAAELECHRQVDGDDDDGDDDPFGPQMSRMGADALLNLVDGFIEAWDGQVLTEISVASRRRTAGVVGSCGKRAESLPSMMEG